MVTDAEREQIRLERDREMLELALKSPPTPITDDVRVVFQALRRMTVEERGLVLCWFCPRCLRYVGPGDSCSCPA